MKDRKTQILVVGLPLIFALCALYWHEDVSPLQVAIFYFMYYCVFLPSVLFIKPATPEKIAEIREAEYQRKFHPKDDNASRFKYGLIEFAWFSLYAAMPIILLTGYVLHGRYVPWGSFGLIVLGYIGVFLPIFLYRSFRRPNLNEQMRLQAKRELVLMERSRRRVEDWNRRHPSDFESWG